MPSPLSHALQTAYADLLDKLLDAQILNLRDEGGFVSKTVKGRKYWYLQKRDETGAVKQTYVGPETEDLLTRIERHREIKETQQIRRDVVRSLVRGGAASGPPPRVGRVLQALSDSGVFRVRGVLVGTVAYQTYGPMLGVRLGSGATMTEEIDLAQFRSVSIAVEEQIPPVIDALRTAETDFEPVTKPLHDKAPISFISHGRSTKRHEALKVEFLTPMRGPDEDGIAKLPALGTGAQPRRFLDFLIYQEQKAVILHDAGILVNVPDPARFALHKLIVSQRRSNPVKVRKDLLQAETLLSVLAEQRPHDVVDYWAELALPGRVRWQAIAKDGLNQIAPPVREKVLGLI